MPAGTDEGVATLEDGLWVLEKNLKDPAFVAKMAKFVKASMKGWDYAKNHPDEAVKIILAGDSTGAKTEKDQKRMMTEVGKLLDTGTGKLDVKDYDRTVAELMAGAGTQFDPSLVGEFVKLRPQLEHFLHALIHPDRSVSGFPTSLHWTWPRVRLSVRERRMQSTNAAKFRRKSGGA